jgi:mRNA interferase MazF
MVRRGEIWWADFGTPRGSEPGYRRPIVVVSGNALNDSELKTVLTIPVTANLTRERYRGNVRLPAGKATGLGKPSVAVVSLVNSTNRTTLVERAGRVPDDLMSDIDRGLRLVLAL